MKQIIILLLLSLSLISVSAIEGLDLTIKNDTVRMKGFIMSDFYGKIPASFFDDVNETIANPFRCDNYVTILNNETKTFQENCTLSIDYSKSIIFKFNQSVGTIIGDTELQNKYEICLIDKASLNAGMTSCVKDKESMKNYEGNYTDCTNQLNTCNTNRNTAETTKATCETNLEDQKNNKYIWAAVAAIITGVIIYYRKGELGREKAKDTGGELNINKAT